MKNLKLNTWQWVFVGFLAIMTIWSIYAELSMSGAHGAPHEPGEAHEAHGPDQQTGHGEGTQVQPPEQKTGHEETAALHEHEPEHEQGQEKVHKKEQEHGGGHWQSPIPFFWILFGFFGCLLLIVFAKNLLALIIYKKEDYYNE